MRRRRPPRLAPKAARAHRSARVTRTHRTGSNFGGADADHFGRRARPASPIPEGCINPRSGTADGGAMTTELNNNNWRGWLG
jgi:hypothetical protein